MSSNSSQRPPETLPFIEVEEFAGRLSKLLKDFVNGHHELMQTAAFVQDQREQLDSAAIQLEQAISRTFPLLDSSIREECVVLLQPIFESLRPRPASLSQEEQEDKNAEVRATFNEVHDSLRKITPPGHALPILHASTSTIQRRNRSSRLLESLLISLVAEYEVMLSNLFGGLLRRYPEAALTADKSVKWGFIASQPDLDSLKDRIMDSAVMELMYKSHGEWLDKLASMRISVPTIARDPGTNEVFQRRHVIVHNGGRASAAYVAKSKLADKPEINAQLPVDFDYLKKAADRLLSSGLIIIASTAQKKIPDTLRQSLDVQIENAVFGLLPHRRFESLVTTVDAIDIVKFGSEKQQYRCKVNHWLALKRLDRFEECRSAVEAWDPTEVGEEFVLARYALLDDFAEGLPLVKELRDAGKLSLENWSTWPLLEELRAAELDEIKQHSL